MYSQIYVFHSEVAISNIDRNKQFSENDFNRQVRYPWWVGHSNWWGCLEWGPTCLVWYLWMSSAVPSGWTRACGTSWFAWIHWKSCEYEVNSEFLPLAIISLFSFHFLSFLIFFLHLYINPNDILRKTKTNTNFFFFRDRQGYQEWRYTMFYCIGFITEVCLKQML